MKIALVSRYYNKHQGIPHDVAELAEQFVEHHEVHVFTQFWEDNDDRIVFHRVPGVATKHYLNELFFFVFSGLMLRMYRFDIINYHDPCFHSGGVFTCHAFPQAGVKIMEAFCKNHDVGISSDFFKPFKQLFPISNFNMKPGRAKKVISVSGFLKEEMRELLGRDPGEVDVIPNGVDLAQFNNKTVNKYRKELRCAHNINEGDFVILFVGYYHIRKGLQYLIQALGELEVPEIKILVVGEDESAEPFIQKILESHKLQSRVIYAGSQTDVHRYFSVGDILALPSLYEPFGNVVLEAMACGLPPVLTSLTGASDIVTHGLDGIKVDDPDDYISIAKEIKTLYDNPLKTAQLSNNAQISAAKYGWKLIAEKTLDVFQHVVDNRVGSYETE